MFSQFSFISFACVSKGCAVVSVAFFEVCCKSQVWFCWSFTCHRCLVHHISLEALKFKGTFIFFLQLHPSWLLSWRWCDIWKDAFVVWCDTQISCLACTSSWALAYVCWRSCVVGGSWGSICQWYTKTFFRGWFLGLNSLAGCTNCNVPFSFSFISRLLCLWVVCELVITSAFFKCFLVGSDGCLEDFFTGWNVY